MNQPIDLTNARQLCERLSVMTLLLPLRRFDFSHKQASWKHEKLGTSTRAPATTFAARERHPGTRQTLLIVEVKPD